MSSPLIHEISSNIKQIEQVNGYYLISFELKKQVSINQLIGHDFVIEPIAKEPKDVLLGSSLQLFLLPSPFSPSYQFLATQPLNTDYLEKTEQRKHIQLRQLSNNSSSMVLPENNKACIILASENRLANAFALARLRKQSKEKTVVFLHAQHFPFMPKPARYWAPEMPDEAIGACSLLEDWGIINRLASNELMAGCYQGSLVELYEEWAQNIEDIDNWQIINLED